MNESKNHAKAAVLIEQLKAVVDNPDIFSSQRQEIIRLSRRVAVTLGEPFETFQRLAYSVSLANNLIPRLI
jgi:hypothetical protein